MGQLVEGKWVVEPLAVKGGDGSFKRKDATFRNWITPDGASGFKAEPGRYHLYVSHACPWAHRTTIYRALKGLEEIISVSVVHWYMGDDGWNFAEGDGDTVNGVDFLHQIYTKVDPDFTGRVTVPVLWDKQEQTIVSNESSEIIRMFNTAFDKVGAKEGDYYPVALREEIDVLNARIYDTLNNGVYKSGFARTQKAYEAAVLPLFETLDFLESRLAVQRFLTGRDATEADWRLFPTLVRFDPVYVGHFKCNIRRIADYPNLSGYLRDLYQHPGIAETVHMDHIKGHYYASHTSINPTGIVPVGPDLGPVLS